MKLFLIVLFILNTLHLTAQEKMICFSVLSNDLSASTECRLDDKGKACALIKIQAMDKIEKVEGDIIGKLIVKGNEAWVYLKPGSTKIKIFFGKHSPIELVFADYGIKALESKVSYSLELLLVDYDYLDSLDVKIVTALADDSFDDQKYGIAASYYMNAANRGLPIAQFDLGYCYRYGYGVPKNYAKMIYWYKKSLDNGYANALCALGECYAIGLGVDIDDVKACDLFQKAIKITKGDVQAAACANLAKLYLDGKGVSPSMDRGIDLLIQAANLGCVEAQTHLGIHYLKGKYVDRNEKEAAKWFLKAAQSGSDLAQYNIGLFYLDGIGVKEDKLQAYYWFQKSADMGNASALYNLGVFYENGDCVAKNYVKAVECYRKSAEKGDVYAQYALAECYFEGKGIDVDIDKAACWYKKAAVQGFKDAETKLKQMGF